jgi:hypothetical protein
MKTILFLLLCLPSLSFGQAASNFDIATFRSPAGWKKQVTQNSIQFSSENKPKGTYCLITLFKSMPAIGNAKENFDAAWSTVVAEAVSPASSPEMFPADSRDGWEVTSGHAPFQKDGSPGVAVLLTLTGNDKMMIALILTNTSEHESAISAFLASVHLKPPTASVPRPAAASSDNSAIVGQWGISVSPQDSFSVNNGINGYTTRQYTFNPNGTYEFLIKLFAYTSNQILFTRETGTYQLDGSTLSLSPQKGSIQAWSKATVTAADGRPAQTDKFGKLINTQAWPLEKVSYQIAREYMSGSEKWQLRMQTTNPTRRDGPFTGSSAWPNTYFYETMRFPIDPPR